MNSNTFEVTSLGTCPDGGQDGSAMVVLLVEDLSDDVFFFKLALRRAGLKPRIFVAQDGTEAVDYLTNKGQFADRTLHPKPDLVFLDLKMPNMNGFELLEWVAQQKFSPPLKIVVLTGSEEPGDRVRAQGLGALAYIIKPPQPATLIEFFAQARQAATADAQPTVIRSGNTTTDFVLTTPHRLPVG